MKRKEKNDPALYRRVWSAFLAFLACPGARATCKLTCTPNHPPFANSTRHLISHHPITSLPQLLHYTIVLSPRSPSIIRAVDYGTCSSHSFVTVTSHLGLVRILRSSYHQLVSAKAPLLAAYYAHHSHPFSLLSRLTLLLICTSTFV